MFVVREKQRCPKDSCGQIPDCECDDGFKKADLTDDNGLCYICEAQPTSAPTQVSGFSNTNNKKSIGLDRFYYI